MYWVTSIRAFPDKQSEILKDLKGIDARPVFINQHLYEGLVETKYLPVSSEQQSVADIQRKINDISYDPLTLSIHFAKIPDFDIDTGLRSIIKALIWQYMKLRVVDITRMVVKQATGFIISYTPYIQTITDSRPVYIQESTSGVFRTACDLTKFVGLEVYTDDRIGSFVLSTMDLVDDIRIISNLMVGPVNNNLKEHIQTKVAIYRSDFHFYFTVDNCEYNYTWLSSEFANLWQIPELYQQPNGKVYRSHFDPGMDTEAWFNDSLLNIWRDRLPVVQVPAWKLSDDLSENNITDVLIAKAKAIRAYAITASVNPALARAIFGVNSLDNGIIEIPVASSKDRDIFSEAYHSGYKTSITWNVLAVKSLKHGVLSRYLIQKRGLLSFLFTLGASEFVVYTVGRDLLPTFTEADYKSAETELRASILSQHSSCINIDSYTHSDVMILLSLIPVKDDNEADSYCFPASELLSLNLPVNPETRVPLSEYAISMSHHIQYGFRGYFNVPGLNGEYEKYPYKHLVAVNSGSIQVLSVSDDYLSVNLVREKYPEHLFDIMLPESESGIIQIALNNLWNSGYLLSDWGTVLYDTLEEISMKPIRNWSALTRAADSPLDGALAMAFIQRAEHEIL